MLITSLGRIAGGVASAGTSENGRGGEGGCGKGEIAALLITRKRSGGYGTLSELEVAAKASSREEECSNANDDAGDDTQNGTGYDDGARDEGLGCFGHF